MPERLWEMTCEACRGDVPLARDEEIARWRMEIPRWEIVEVDGMKRLRRSFRFANFRQALDFTTRVGELAEAEGHHPEMVTGWGNVTVSWWTHKIGGLHRNDFIMAARTDGLASQD